MADRRDRLAQRRIMLGYSQEQFAELAKVATSTVVRWETGKADPRPYQRSRLAKILELTLAELDDLLDTMLVAVCEASPAPLLDGDADDMKRRDVLGLLAVTGALIALPRADSTDDLFTAPADAEAALNGQLWALYGAAESKQDTYPLVRHQLAVLARRLETASSEAERLQLCALTGDLYQLAGEVFFDANRYTDAAHCYTLAAAAAKEAGQHDLWACAMTRHAFIELYERRFTVAAPILAAAEQVAQRGDSQLSTRYWVSAVHAEAYAGLGDLAACDRALDFAEQVHALDGPIHNGGWLRFDGSRLAEERGTCYLGLNRPDLAEDALASALAQELSPRRRAAVLAELAAIGAQRGDVDRVVEYSSTAIGLAGQTGSGYIARKLEALQPRLAPLLSDRRVSELHHRISALGSAA